MLKPTIKVKTEIKTLINACIELVTVNGRPYSVLDDTSFRKVIDSILSGIQNIVVLNSSSIKFYLIKKLPIYANLIYLLHSVINLTKKHNDEI